MKINKVHFINGLDNKLEDIYSFFADESIQITELTDEVIKRAKTKGFEEKQTFIITKDTDWTFLNSTNENLDLFGSKKIIEIKLIGSGPGNKGSKVIKDYCLAPDSNKLLIISAEKLDKKQQSSAWAKALDENGIIVVEPPVSKASMPEWIRAKSSDLKLKLANQAIELLSDKTEGNLFAASQELMKLSLFMSS